MRLEKSLILHIARQPELVDKKDIANNQKVKVGPVRGQEDYGKIAILLYLSYALQHLHVYYDLLIEVLEQFMESPPHALQDRNLYFPNQAAYDFLGLCPHSLIGSRLREFIFLNKFIRLCLNGLQYSAGRQYFSSQFVYDFFFVGDNFIAENPLDIAKVLIFRMHFE